MGNCDYNNTNRISRRNILRSAGITGAGIGFGIQPARASHCRIPNEYQSSSEEEYEEKYTDVEFYVSEGSSYKYDRAIEMSSSVIYAESVYADDHWNHFFRTGGYAVTKRKESYESDSAYSFYPNIYEMRLTLESRDSVSALLTPSESNQVGAYPPPSGWSHESYGKAAYTVMLAVLSTNPKLGAAITAGQAISAFVDNNESASGSTHEYPWKYDTSDDICE